MTVSTSVNTSTIYSFDLFPSGKNKFTDLYGMGTLGKETKATLKERTKKKDSKIVRAYKFYIIIIRKRR